MNYPIFILINYTVYIMLIVSVGNQLLLLYIFV